MPFRFRTANIYKVVFAIGDPIEALKRSYTGNAVSTSAENLQISERLLEYGTARGIPGVAHAHPQNAGTTAYRTDTTVHGAVRATVTKTEHSRVAWLGGKRQGRDAPADIVGHEDGLQDKISVNFFNINK